jgi:hypothetical protein
MPRLPRLMLPRDKPLPQCSFRLQARLYPTIHSHGNGTTARTHDDDPARGRRWMDTNQNSRESNFDRFPPRLLMRQALLLHHLNIVYSRSHISLSFLLLLLPHAPIVASTLPACCPRASRQELTLRVGQHAQTRLHKFTQCDHPTVVTMNPRRPDSSSTKQKQKQKK